MSLPWDTQSSPVAAPPLPRPATHARPELGFEPQIGSRDEDSIDGPWLEELKESSVWFTRGFWAATGVRAIRTFAQTIVATVTAAGVGVNLSWYNCLLTSAGAAGLSVLMSIDRNMRS